MRQKNTVIVSHIVEKYIKNIHHLETKKEIYKSLKILERFPEIYKISAYRKQYREIGIGGKTLFLYHYSQSEQIVRVLNVKSVHQKQYR